MEGTEAENFSVSVIVVVKNGARFIAQALATIGLSQTKPLEILVVDGNSTDNTVEIAQRVPTVRIIRQKSTGIAGAYNEAVAQARGGVVAFLSCDDLWLPGKLDRHLSVLAEDPKLLVSVSLVSHFLEPGNKIPPGFRAELLDQARPGMLMEALVARKRAFDVVGVFDPRFTTGEDTDWFARAKDGGVRIALIPEILVRKRVHGANASLTDAEGNRNLLRALRASVRRKRAAAHSASTIFSDGQPISVVVPCHNQGNYLAEALESALAQTRPAGEIIVVDDGSSDETRQVASRFGKHVRYVSQSHRGIGSARNTGLKQALGSYIAFLDADDVWPAHSLDIRLKQFEAGPNIDAAMGLTQEFLSPDFRGPPLARLARGPVVVRIAGAMLIKRRAFEQVGWFNETLAVGEWIDWIDRFNHLGFEISVSSELALRRRIHAGNASDQVRDSWRDYLAVLRASLHRKDTTAGLPR
jgi:glycosyltransferase involved in cell wall biosynthesis